MLSRGLRALAVAPAALLALLAVPAPAPAAAPASTVESSNWAGYVVHRSGLHFRSVSGRWRLPAVTCTAGQPAYSAMWVGLGGYGNTSGALEQTGTEADCSAAGHPRYSAWYELVPAPAHRVALAVRPRDLIAGRVTVQDHRVTIALADLTNHHRFQRTFTVGQVDVFAADWILEAPSACDGSRCVTLPLADFRRATFGSARATTRAGITGTIASARWASTRTLLIAGAPHFTAVGAGAPGGDAITSALGPKGASFAVTYTSAAAGVQAYVARRFRWPRSAALVH